MSLSLMVQVMTKVTVSRPQQAVLLAMAEHASDDGSSCFPSVDLIAWKLEYKPRAVSDIMRELRRAGILIEVAPASQHRPTEYRINLAAAPPKQDFEMWKAAHGRHRAPHSGVQSDVSRDAVSRESEMHSDVQGCNLTSPEVQSRVNGIRETAPEPLGEPSKKENDPLESPFAVPGDEHSDPPVCGVESESSGAPEKPLRRKPKTPVPDVFPLTEDHYAYGAEKGLDRRRVEDETEGFLLYHRREGSLFSDWYAAWQGWIRKVRLYQPPSRVAPPRNRVATI